MNNIEDKAIIVLYHAGCPDGFSGAWVAHKKFGNQAAYIPIAAGATAPDMGGKDVYLIDIIPQENGLREFITKNKSVIAIDHHETNRPLLTLFSDSHFNVSKSGSALAWEYFFPDQKMPFLLECIQDIDLWQWNHPESKTLSSYLNVMDFNFNSWEKLVADFEDPDIRKDIVEKSNLLLRYESKKVQDIIKDNAHLVEFEGMRILAVNSSVLASQIGNNIVESNPPVSIVWVELKDKMYVSLRSDGTVNVGELAEKYGGGGHVRAAGFRIPFGSEKPWKIIHE